MTQVRRTVLLLAALLMMSVAAEAQEPVALRFYIVPKIGSGTFADPFRAKYIRDLAIPYSAMDYGLENTFLAAVNVTAAQNTSLSSNLDVIAIPQNIDATIGLTALGTVQSKLEDLHVPSEWVTTSNTYRDVIRAVGKLFQFMQRFHARQLRTFFESGITLDTRMNELTANQRTALADTSDSFGLDRSAITNTTTVRQALRILFQQLPSFTLMGETF